MATASAPLVGTKRIDKAAGAAVQEIATLQKVLALQQKENIRLQEEVCQLEGEVDDARKIAEKRQNHLNHANDKVASRDASIKTLEETLKAAKVEGKAFEKFSSQNKMLLESYLKEQKESERCKEELDKVSFHAKNLKISVDERAKELTEKEAEYTSEIRHLKETSQRVLKEKTILEDTIKLQTNEIESLRNKLKLNNELRAEEIARSRQSEYKTLLRAEMTTLELQKVVDQKEMLMESVNLSSTRAQTLDDRLKKASSAAHENEDMLHAFVQKAEENTNVWRVEERKLRKENDALMLKLSTMKQALRNVTESNHGLEEKMASQTKYIKKLKKGLTGDENLSRITGKNNRLSKSLNYDRSLNQSLESTIDNMSTDTDSMTFHEEPSLESGLNTGLNQSSLLSAGETTLHSNDMYQSLDTMQYQGKRSLLAKHLRHIVTLYNTVSVPESLKGKTFDLARCALTDDDMSQVIDWLRLMSIRGISLLDMRSNLMTGRGCLFLAAFLLSLGGDDLVERDETLEINCQYNMVIAFVSQHMSHIKVLCIIYLVLWYACYQQVTKQDIPNIMAYLIRTPRPEIKYIDTESNGQVIVVYGHMKDKRGGSSAILRWNFEFNNKGANGSQSYSS